MQKENIIVVYISFPEGLNQTKLYSRYLLFVVEIKLHGQYFNNNLGE